MLEFFGMKPITGPNSCFQFIEDREPPPPSSKKFSAQQKSSQSALPDGDGGVAGLSAVGVAKNRNGKKDERSLWEPGPEHFAGADDIKEIAGSADDYTGIEAQVVDNENDRGFGVLSEDRAKKAEESEQMVLLLNKSREEVKQRQSRNSLRELQPNEPGPEYFNGVGGAVATAAAEDRESRPQDEVPGRGEGGGGVGGPDNDFQISPAAVAARNAAKEGGGFGNDPSMATTNATAADATASTTTVTVAAAGTGTGASMDSGNSGGGGAFVLIKGAQIVNDDSIYVADVLIQDNIIQQVSSNIEAPPGAQVIDGIGKALMPAGIDIHTEFSSPDSVDDFETGTKGALAGGTTTVIDVIHPGANETLLAAYDRLCKAAESKSICNFAFSAVISEWNDLTKKEMNLLVHDKGINSFIIEIQKDDQLFEILDFCRSLRVHARIIPENKDIITLLEKRLRASGITGAECFLLSRPQSLEADMVNRVAVLGKLTSCPVAVVSLCSAEAADVVLRQRSNSLIPEIPVSALDEKGDGRGGSTVLKSLWRYVESPSPLISCLSSIPLCICVSDHRRMRNKTLENFGQHGGVSAAEERMPVLWEKGVLSGHIDLMRFVALTSSNAAKVFNLYPRKGRIAVGADADLVLWELPVKHQILNQQQQRTGFDALTGHSKPVMTICGGRIAYSVGKVSTNGSVDGGGGGGDTDLSHRRENLSNNIRSFPVKNVPKQYDSSYSEKPNELRGMRASTKILNPPGGRSTGFW